MCGIDLVFNRIQFDMEPTKYVIKFSLMTFGCLNILGKFMEDIKTPSRLFETYCKDYINRKRSD